MSSESTRRTYLIGDLVEDGGEVAHMRTGEDWVQHLALLLVALALGKEQTRSNYEVTQTTYYELEHFRLDV